MNEEEMLVYKALCEADMILTRALFSMHRIKNAEAIEAHNAIHRAINTWHDKVAQAVEGSRR